MREASSKKPIDLLPFVFFRQGKTQKRNDSNMHTQQQLTVCVCIYTHTHTHRKAISMLRLLKTPYFALPFSTCMVLEVKEGGKEKKLFSLLLYKRTPLNSFFSKTT